MIVPQFRNAPDAPAPSRPRPLVVNQALDGQVQTGLNLCLPLKTPAQMLALLDVINAEKEPVFKALKDLNYVHFARFLPSPDGSVLWVITTFDGELESYIMDFVAVIGDVFTKILYFIRDAPRLPVNQYPRDFVEFVTRNNVAQATVWSAYGQVTVIDILRSCVPA